MNPHDFLETARDLVNSNPRRPRQSNLRRATSTAYYAVFHKLARCAADLMMGGKTVIRSSPAWRQVYRALEHGPAKNACKSPKIAAFPAPIQEFANAFVAMQEKRHNADYDPQSTFLKSEVLVDIELAERAIEGFDTTPLRDRRAFVAFVLFKDRI